MKLESQVCSLELAKRLKELGVKQESYWYWTDTILNSAEDDLIKTAPLIFDQHELKKLRDCSLAEEVNKTNIFSAFSVGELGEMLGELGEILGVETEFKKVLTINGPEYGCLMSIARADRKGAIEIHSQWAMTEVDARAKMLIYLLENTLIPQGDAK